MQEILLTQNVLNVEDIIENLLDPACGALAIFLGSVRDKEKGETITSIKYDSYPAMAEKQLKSLAAEATEKFGVRIIIHHRLGSIPVKGVSLIVACAAPHRKEAFESAQFIVERIKQDVPIWKVEFEKAGV